MRSTINLGPEFTSSFVPINVRADARMIHGDSHRNPIDVAQGQLLQGRHEVDQKAGEVVIRFVQ